VGVLEDLREAPYAPTVGYIGLVGVEFLCNAPGRMIFRWSTMQKFRILS
jgi:hypothetical protein